MNSPPYDPAMLQEVLTHRLGKALLEEATQTATVLTLQRRLKMAEEENAQLRKAQAQIEEGRATAKRQAAAAAAQPKVAKPKGAATPRRR